MTRLTETLEHIFKPPLRISAFHLKLFLRYRLYHKTLSRKYAGLVFIITFIFGSHTSGKRKPQNILSLARSYGLHFTPLNRGNIFHFIGHKLFM